MGYVKYSLFWGLMHIYIRHAKNSLNSHDHCLTGIKFF